jgi:hypothetical protein
MKSLGESDLSWNAKLKIAIPFCFKVCSSQKCAEIRIEYFFPSIYYLAKALIQQNK